MKRIYGKGFPRVAGTKRSVTHASAFTAAMHVCDPTLEGHTSRVMGYAEALATRLGWDSTQLEELRLGSALHDVGKVNIRPDVLSKPGALDESELAAIRTHPVEGAWLIGGLRALAPALPYVLFHHERWDGGGYPTGRRGESIPLPGRLLAVADAFDAMTSERTYRAALSPGDALGEVERCAGTQFDPALASAFVDAFGAGELAPAEPAYAG
jgi:HD-GYP domain-containing protein (c-di-GMP phosphodiesterase class II)